MMTWDSSLKTKSCSEAVCVSDHICDERLIFSVCCSSIYTDIYCFPQEIPQQTNENDCGVFVLEVTNPEAFQTFHFASAMPLTRQLCSSSVFPMPGTGKTAALFPEGHTENPKEDVQRAVQLQAQRGGLTRSVHLLLPLRTADDGVPPAAVRCRTRIRLR